MVMTSSMFVDVATSSGSDDVVKTIAIQCEIDYESQVIKVRGQRSRSPEVMTMQKSLAL